MNRTIALALAAVVAATVVPARPARGGDAKGKTFYRGTYGARVRTLDPAGCDDTTSATIQAHVFEALYGYHYLKRPVEVVPVLAAGMPKVSADGLTVTIRLKPDVRYARNACFGRDAAGRVKTRAATAADVVLAIKRVADRRVRGSLAGAMIAGRIVGLDAYRRKTGDYPAGDFGRYDLKVEGLSATDDRTVRIKLVRPWPQLVHVLAMHCFAPIPREAVDRWLTTTGRGEDLETIPVARRRADFTRPEQMVGIGPYVMKVYEPAGRIVFVRNPDFRDERYPAEGAAGDRAAGLLADAGKRLPFIDEVRLDYARSPLDAWRAFDAGRTEMTGVPSEVFDDVLTAALRLKKPWADRGIVLMKNTYPAVYWIVFNMDDPVVGSSKALRQALCLSFDAAGYIKAMHNGRGRPAVSVIPSTIAGHRAPGAGKHWRLDRAAAKARLAQARKELAAAGRLDGGQLPALTLHLPGRDAATKKTGEFVKAQFARVGVDLKVVGNDWPTLQKKVSEGTCQMFTMGWHADYPDAENFLQLFYSPNIKAGTNNSRYADAEYDKLYEKAHVMADSPRRTKIYAQMARMIAEDCPVLLLSEPVRVVLRQRWMLNVKPHPIAYGSVKYWRIDPAGRRTAATGRATSGPK